jgi:competence protein ComFC
MKIVNIYQKIATEILDTLFPKVCIECGRYGGDVCINCIKKIEKVKTSTCFYCGKIHKLGLICARCRGNNNTNITGIITSAIYDEGPTKEMIHFLKYCGYRNLSEMLGELIVERLKDSTSIENAVVVPVPMHKNREIARGYNQAELLARYISKELDLPGGLALTRTEDNPQQMKLTRGKRLENMKGTIECVDRELVRGKKVLLIDDVATTGATLSECAKVLKEAGAKKVWGAVVARG